MDWDYIKCQKEGNKRESSDRTFLQRSEIINSHQQTRYLAADIHHQYIRVPPITTGLNDGGFGVGFFPNSVLLKYV